MFNMESTLVNNEYVQRKDTYNIKEGGFGGPVNMKETDYYRSGFHIKNMTDARNKAAILSKQRKVVRIDMYDNDPILCKQCNSSLCYRKRHNKFCSKSCAGTYNGSRKLPRTEASKAITSAAMKRYFSEKLSEC